MVKIEREESPRPGPSQQRETNVKKEEESDTQATASNDKTDASKEDIER